MSPSTPFIQRPVATALLMLAIVLSGLVGYRFLPLAALPQVDFPTIQVQTLYPGASPEVMARTVTAPLERQFGQMSGLTRMSSTSAAGVSMVTRGERAITASRGSTAPWPLPVAPGRVPGTGAAGPPSFGLGLGTPSAEVAALPWSAWAWRVA